MKTYIWCTFRVEGVHYWPKAHNCLVHPHRHLFHFKVRMSVKHGDREVEFIALKNELKCMVSSDILPGITVTLSCEQIGKTVLSYLIRNYGEDREYVVEVSEDGENGAEVFYP